MRVTELGYVSLGVSDLGAWKEFLGEVVGFEVVDAGDGVCLVRMDYWHHRLVLRANGRDDLDAVGWRVEGARAFEEVQKSLERRGAQFTVASAKEAENQHVLAYLRTSDPAGNAVEIFYGPHVETAMPFYPGRRLHGGFVTGSKGLGHVVYDLPNTEECASFYREVLGLEGSVELKRPSAGGTMHMHFMSCNQRQHSLAFAPLKRGKKIAHLMTEYARLEDVGLARDIARRRGIATRMEIGQHHNDGALSFYLQTPSGWSWELGWGVGQPSGQAEYGELEIWGHDLLTATGQASK